MTTQLSPAQQGALDELKTVLPIGRVFRFHGATGAGTTTVLRALHDEQGGAFLNMQDFLDMLHRQHPQALEETFERIVMDALQVHDLVIVDDFHLLNNVICCHHMYQRMGLMNVPMMTLATYAVETGKTLIFAVHGSTPEPLRQRAYHAGIGDFTPADYEFLCRAYLPTGADRLDYKKIFRFAPKLNAHQLKGACLWFSQRDDLATDSFMDYLRSRHLASNVDLGEVQAVNLRDLKGVDEVIRSLEANIILPLENDDLAAELNLKPKRGVLLAGPPGTGKTTIGRALAHRLKSKFFLIDGTFISGTGNFYGAVHHIFETAKQNAPSIIFIDDSDVIFESGEEMGLYRYLLTMLDGLESQSAGRVCVMMTAMTVSNLPPALIRSGRIELWLEMRLPDADARASILADYLAGLPDSLANVDSDRVVASTEGFTGADIKRLVEDTKTLYAYDKVQRVPLRAATEYFLAAVETVRVNKERYAQAEATARQQRPTRPVYYGSFNGMTDD